jgi:hypothetical protein
MLLIRSIDLLLPFQEFIINGTVNVAGFQIINMPRYCVLLAFDDLVGNTGIIWIDFKSNGLNILSKLLVIE